MRNKFFENILSGKIEVTSVIRIYWIHYLCILWYIISFIKKNEYTQAFIKIHDSLCKNLF